MGEGVEGEPRRLAGDLEFVYALFDEMPLMVLRLESPEHRISAITGVYRQFIGRDEVVGAPLREMFPELIGQQVMPIFDRVYATGEPESVRDFRIQFYRPGLGENAEIFLNSDTAARRGPDGEVSGLVIHVQDATARVRERQAARVQAAEAQRRYERARDVIDALQRELLPAGPPVPPRLEVAASYLLADQETAAGGDWFDAVVLADGRVGLVVGDVVGHGVSASATMGQLRVCLHERLVATGDLRAGLQAVNEAASWIPGARAATVCAAVVDPASGAVVYATVGHPPPLMIPASGEAGFLPPTGASPVGTGGEVTEAQIGTAKLDPGATLLLYTDGILERPGRELAGASVELAQVAADALANRAFQEEGSDPAERMCTQTVELLTRTSGHSDDITLLAARRTDAPEPFRLVLSATGEQQLMALRTEFGRWLRQCGAGADDECALRHAVVELATNSLEHAYLDRVDDGTTCDVTAELNRDERLSIVVTDRGAWREPSPSPDRGLGLQVASGMVERLHLNHDEHGTTATIEHTLTRPAHLLTADRLGIVPAGSPQQADPLLILDQPWAPAPRIRIDGPIDAATVEQVQRAINSAGAVGARDLTVDLAGVSHLASAGVAALHLAAAAHRDNHTRLHLYAPTGTPAETIMTLVELEHLTDDPHEPEAEQ